MSDSVSRDLYCVTCRYNLRTLRLDGRCPECGTSVRESVNAPRDEHFTQLIIVFVAYLVINVAVYVYMLAYDRGLLFDIGPILYLYGPLSVCIAAAAYSVRRRFPWAYYVAFIAAMALVAAGNLYFYIAAGNSV